MRGGGRKGGNNSRKRGRRWKELETVAGNVGGY